ncbi:hypothetical protein EVAR_28545_1 [Eumeta japonica]|uniref:Uncharacterized protein n=1 Tax=Eumeta variegata TaxID=151549 RepID=A0A4C1UY14_EUMVA|nr:hypothetical protein EVAR_28545_1 [Eumeta japonica]
MYVRMYCIHKQTAHGRNNKSGRLKSRLLGVVAEVRLECVGIDPSILRDKRAGEPTTTHYHTPESRRLPPLMDSNYPGGVTLNVAGLFGGNRISYGESIRLMEKGERGPASAE